MLSRGATAAFQKVVLKVSDLPSPLSVGANERVIVRETEEVYGIDATSGSWAVVGSLKRVGGKRPEELAAHLDSKANPHETTLGQVLAAGADAELEQGLVLRAKSQDLKALVRLLQRAGALRIGPDVGQSTAAIWLNMGGAACAAVRVVDGDGNDRLVLEADGSLRAVGSAEFRGGVVGRTEFHDEIVADQIYGPDAISNGSDADGVQLEISSGRARGAGKAAPLVLSVGAADGGRGQLGSRKQMAFITERGLGVGKMPEAALDVAGDLRLTGAVDADLRPSKSHKSLGTVDARWRLAASSVDVAGAADAVPVRVAVAPDQKAALLVFSRRATGDVLMLDEQGRLGLGAAAPTHTLDVRGDGIAVGEPVGDARFVLGDARDGNVRLNFNAAPDGTAADENLHSWSFTPGGRADVFEVARRGKKGTWRSLLRLDEHGLTLHGDLNLQGLLRTTAPLAVNRIGGLSGASSIDFGTGIDYAAGGTLQEGAAHRFKAALGKGASAAVLMDVVDKGAGNDASLLRLQHNGEVRFDLRTDGTLHAKALGTAAAPAKEAYLESAHVGRMSLEGGAIQVDGDLELRATTGAVKIGERLLFANGVELQAVEGGFRLGGVGNMLLHETGIAVDRPTASVRGFGHFETGRPALSASRPGLHVRQQWKGSAAFEASVVEVEEDGSAAASMLMAYRLNKQLLMGLHKDKLDLRGDLIVNGLGLQRLHEVVTLTGERTATTFKVPAGVKIESVVLKVVDPPKGVAFMQAGDPQVPDRFAGPSTKLEAGAVTRGLNHCDRGQAVQWVESPVVVTTNEKPVGGKVSVTVYYMNPMGQD